LVDEFVDFAPPFCVCVIPPRSSVPPLSMTAPYVAPSVPAPASFLTNPDKVFRTHRLEHGVFFWPSNAEPAGTLMLTSAQLSMLIDRVDWRAPDRQWRPALAG
jgi:hypothetical protein